MASRKNNISITIVSSTTAIVCRHSDLYCLSVILRQINSDSSPIFPHHIPVGIPPQRLTRIKISVCTRRIYLLIVGIKYLQCKTRLLNLRMTRVLQYSSIFQEQQIRTICINSICPNTVYSFSIFCNNSNPFCSFRRISSSRVCG